MANTCKNTQFYIADNAKEIIFLVGLLFFIFNPIIAIGNETLLENNNVGSDRGNSLMFPDERVKMLENILSNQGLFLQSDDIDIIQDKNFNVPLLRNLYFSSLIYMSGNDWIAWVGGEKVTPQYKTVDFLILETHPKRIKIAVYDESGGINRFDIYPNQTYIASEKKIVEGRRY